MVIEMLWLFCSTISAPALEDLPKIGFMSACWVNELIY